jgi:transcriptional regulator with XRE-family HTH domain
MTADELRALRQQLGQTQHQLADALGIRSMTVSRWETGWNPIPPLGATALRLYAQLHDRPGATRSTSAAVPSPRSGGRRRPRARRSS